VATSTSSSSVSLVLGFRVTVRVSLVSSVSCRSLQDSVTINVSLCLCELF